MLRFKTSSICALVILAGCASHRPQSHLVSRGPAGVSLKSICDLFSVGPSKKSPFNAFVPGQNHESVQIGVDPKSLIPTLNLENLRPERLRDADFFARDHSISVTSLGFVLEGHHRLLNALKAGRSVDVKVVSLDYSIRPEFVSRKALVVKNEEVLSAYEMSHIKSAMASGALRENYSFKHRNPMLAYAHFETFHPVLQRALIKYLQYRERSEKSARQLVESLESQFSIDEMDTFLETLQSMKVNSQKLEDGILNFKQLEITQRQEHSVEATAWTQTHLAARDWQTFYYSRIPIDTSTDGQRFVSIKGVSYPARLSGKSAILTVPTSMVRHPAWNPLDHLQEVARNTWGGRSVYDAPLGLDGNFYLSDGNHRFAIYDARKKTVQIKLVLSTNENDGSLFVTTKSLRHFIDDMGLFQPSSEDLVRLRSKAIDPVKLIPEHLATTLMPITERP